MAILCGGNCIQAFAFRHLHKSDSECKQVPEDPLLKVCTCTVVLSLDC